MEYKSSIWHLALVEKVSVRLLGTVDLDIVSDVPCDVVVNLDPTAVLVPCAQSLKGIQKAIDKVNVVEIS
jgi:hypothetical protein